MSNPVSRGSPFVRPPSPVTTWRSERSFMSRQRRQRDRVRVDPELVAVDGCARRVGPRAGCLPRHRMQVAGEVEVQVLHRDDLRVAAAGRAALDPEDRPERRLADAEHRVGAEQAEPLREPDSRRRLPLALRRRRDRGDTDELPVRPVGEPVENAEVDLALVAAVRVQLVRLETEPGRDLLDRPHRRGLCDLQARHRCAGWLVRAASRN